MSAMAACRRSARLAPLAQQRVVTNKVLPSKFVKEEPCTSPYDVSVEGAVVSTPPKSGSKRKLSFDKNGKFGSKTAYAVPRVKLGKMTNSSDVVKQEEVPVDKYSKPPPNFGGMRKGNSKIEAKNVTKKNGSRNRNEKPSAAEEASDGLKLRMPLKKGTKKVKADSAALSNVKEELLCPEKIETGMKIELLATGTSPALSAQTTLELAVAAGSPYPDFARPYPEECYEVRNRLSELHGLGTYVRPTSCPSIDPVDSRNLPEVLALEYRSGASTVLDTVGNSELAVMKEQENEDKAGTTILTSSPSVRRTVLDSLVGTILSQNTTDNNSKRAFTSLKQAFPTWEQVHAADPKKVEDAIRCGGLAETKTKRIISILDTIFKERGSICLEYVRSMTVDQIKAELSRFKGVGPKTVACVLMFHLEQHEFPVDTHVFRLSKMLGWVPANADREKTYLHMNSRVPDEVKYDLHCLLVTHGKRCPRCAKGGRAQTSPDGPCPLINWSPKMTPQNNREVKLLKEEA